MGGNIYNFCFMYLGSFLKWSSILNKYQLLRCLKLSLTLIFLSLFKGSML